MNNDKSDSNKGTPIFEVWEKYENIAMHFNDLIVKIRTQALGAVAVITTIVGIISKGDTGTDYNWVLLASIFFYLIIFWIAIWVLDFFYYNRLLEGAVKSIIEIEKKSKNGETHIKEINLSQNIKNAVAGEEPEEDNSKEYSGRTRFYIIVFSALLFGLLVSICFAICT